MADTVNGAHIDGINQQFSIIGVIGTLGTADVKGTAPTLPISVNPDNGAVYVQDLSGAAGTTTVAGTLAVNMLSGTFNVGTISAMPNISGGSIAVTTGTVVGNIASDNADSGNPVKVGGKHLTTRVVVADNNDRGDLQIDTYGNLRISPFYDSGTVPFMGDATNGLDVDVVRLPNTPGGTLGLVTRVGNVGTLEVGTISAMPQVSVGTIPNIPGGTVQLNPRPTVNLITYSTTSTGTIGTLVAAPSAGSTVWINDVSINSHNGTVDALVSYGLATNGTPVILRGNYGAQGGQQRGFPQAINGGGITGSAVTWNILGGSGTVTYNLSYFIGTV